MVSHAVKPTHPESHTPGEESLPTLAEVLDRVASDGPQIITRGEDHFVVLAAHQIEPQVLETKRPGLIDALLGGPCFDGVEIEREPWDMRDAELCDRAVPA
ncbi:MAG: hypothetical protein QM589_02955 [Thermomicrobiales bacterium]